MMLRFGAGVLSALLVVAAGLIWWRGGAGARQVIPPIPTQQVATGPTTEPEPMPPQASEATREGKRFDRYDKDRNGGVTREEYLASRRKAFARLDTNNDGRLSFEEWSAKTIAKFATADKDKSGVLTRAEFATTKVARRTPLRRSVDCPQPPTATGDEGD